MEDIVSKSPEPWNTSSFLWGVYKRLLVCFCLKSWFVWTNTYKEGSNCCISQRQLCFMALFAGILPRTPLTIDRRWKNIWNWDERKTLRCISGNAGWTKLESVCPWEPPTLSHTTMSDEGSAHDLANSLLIWVLPGEPVYLRKPVLLQEFSSKKTLQMLLVEYKNGSENIKGLQGHGENMEINAEILLRKWVKTVKKFSSHRKKDFLGIWRILQITCQMKYIRLGSTLF